jgi:hypothetical protein
MRRALFACRFSALLLAALMVAPSAVRAEREFRVYRSLEAQADVDLPPDYQVPGEFVVGRLMYPTSRNFRWFGFGGDWHYGGTTWAVDYPRADRHFAKLLKRLTRVNVRSVEQPVNLDDGDDVFDWPFLMVGLPGMWDLTEDQAHKLREYLLRGGFLFCDSFFGTQEWAGFVSGMRRVFPDRPIIDALHSPLVRAWFSVRSISRFLSFSNSTWLNWGLLTMVPSRSSAPPM